MAYGFDVLVAVGDLGSLAFEEGEFGLVVLDLLFCGFYFLFEDSDLGVELFEFEGFLFVLLAFLDEFIEHVLEVGFTVPYFLDHFGFFLLQRLYFAVEHVPEIL